MTEENKTETPAPAVQLPDPRKLILSTSPHVQGPDTVSGIMRKVLICLCPAVIASVIFFGANAVRVLVLTLLFSLVFEWLCCRIGKRASTLGDFSAAVTGVILALNLPASAPWWLCMAGAFFAIVIAKEIFGGLGQNPFNPAAAARVALLVGFAGPMTNWLKPMQGFLPSPDFVTGATPLGMAKAAQTAEAIQSLQTDQALTDLFLGYSGGSLGETSALAVLTGGIALIAMRIITWHIPAAMLGTVFVFTWIVNQINPALTPGPLFHLCSGGMMIAAFFMATDMVTSPSTRKGMLIFGASIGLIACVIRIWGGYPEGVSFAILIMNALVPLIDRFCYKRPFGWYPSSAAAYQIRRGEVR